MLNLKDSLVYSYPLARIKAKEEISMRSFFFIKTTPVLACFKFILHARMNVNKILYVLNLNIINLTMIVMLQTCDLDCCGSETRGPM